MRRGVLVRVEISGAVEHAPIAKIETKIRTVCAVPTNREKRDSNTKSTISMKISVLALPAILAGNNKAGYTKYTKCLDIDDKGNRVQYRYFCNQGSFFVQVSP